MRHPIPPMHAEVAARKARLPQAHDGHQTPRVHMLYRLVTRQARDRQEVARLLGVHRHTMSRWLAIAAAGGLDTLLATDGPAGTPVSLAPTGLTSLAQALRQGVRLTHGVEVTSQTLATWVRTRFHAKRTVARPRHTPPLTPWPPCTRAVVARGIRPSQPPLRAPAASSARPNVVWGAARRRGAPCRRVGLWRWRRRAHHGQALRPSAAVSARREHPPVYRPIRGGVP
jgi:leucine-zipper of insertion element IS481